MTLARGRTESIWAPKEMKNPCSVEQCSNPGGKHRWSVKPSLETIKREYHDGLAAHAHESGQLSILDHFYLRDFLCVHPSDFCFHNLSSRHPFHLDAPILIAEEDCYRLLPPPTTLFERFGAIRAHEQSNLENTWYHLDGCS